VANSYGAQGPGEVGVLLGNGDGTFQTAVPYYAGVVEPISLEIADINGDGKLDLILGNEGNPTVGVLLGNGDGTFQTAMVFGSGGGYQTSVAVADVNGDGKPDLALSGCLDFSCDSGVVSVFINVSRRATTTMLVSSLNPSSRGQAVTFTATVAGAHGAPTGTVSFFNGTTNIGNSNLNDSDVATLTTSTLAEGTRSITATYSGDANFAPGTSPVLFQVVQGSVVTLSPTSLGFGYQTVGIASAPQDVTLTNTGNVPLIVTSVGIGGTDSGDFAQTNDCPGSVAPKGSCRISVTFTPTAAGTRSAALRVANNAPGSPQNVPLNGSVRNFTVAANSPTSQTVTPGQAANFAVTVSPLDGFAEMVSLHCSGAPAQSTCTVTPSSVALDGTGAVIVNVAAVTAGASMAGTQPIGGPSNGSGLAAWAASAGMVGLGLMVALPNRCPHLRLTYGLAFLCLLSIGIMLPACGGGGGSSGGAGTPTGTYTLTVTGAYPPGSSTLTHTTTLMLIVR
jgi:hypothetical protein